MLFLQKSTHKPLLCVVEITSPAFHCQGFCEPGWELNFGCSGMFCLRAEQEPGK